jgi:hypothetical protein
MTTISRIPSKRRSALKRLPTTKLITAGLLLLTILFALNRANNHGNSNYSYFLSTNAILGTSASTSATPTTGTPTTLNSVVDVTGRTCLARAPLSNVFLPESTIGSGNCSYSWGQGWQQQQQQQQSQQQSQQQQPQPQKEELQSRLKALIKEWKYDNRVKNVMKHWPGRIGKGKRVLDVGMGQGPWGAAMLAVAELEYYVGLDPDVCPPIHAKTRDTSVPRMGSQRQCILAYNLTQDDPDPVQMEACIGKNKYHSFQLTGLQMMAAYPNQLALLPGTFETLSDKLQSMVFDVILLNTVTEHLQQLRPVFEGLWQLMGHGCAQDATVLIDHHNYMDYGGHHGFPKSVKDLETAPPEMLELADWGHLRDDASQSQNPSLNRVRPGDLQALLHVYFQCTCVRTKVGPAEKDRLTPEARRRFTDLGFDVEMELFTKHVLFTCTRRDAPKNIEILDRLKLYHSPLDGSYQPQPFIDCP